MLPVATNDDLGAIKLSDDFTMDADGTLHLNGGSGGNHIEPAAPTGYVNLEPKDGTAPTYMRSDATPGLNQGISPQWTSAHVFGSDVNFSVKPSWALPTNGLNLSSSALTWAVARGYTYEFYVDGNRIGQIDDPSQPQTPDSLVSKQYVDNHVVPQTPKMLDVLVSYGSPKADTAFPGWSPSNLLMVYGPPNLPCVLLLGNGATTDNQSEQPFTIGADGTQQFQIQMAGGNQNQNSWSPSVTVAPFVQGGDETEESWYKALSVMTPVHTNVSFFPSQTDDSAAYVASYSYTRAVPSDGKTECQISVIIDQEDYPSLKSVVMTIGNAESSAVFSNGQKTITSNIQSSGWVTVGVCSSDPGVVQVKISPPASPNDGGASGDIYAYPSFVLPPVIGKLD